MMALPQDSEGRLSGASTRPTTWRPCSRLSTYAVDVLILGELERPFEAPALVRALRVGKHARMQLSPGFANVGHGVGPSEDSNRRRARMTDEKSIEGDGPERGKRVGAGLPDEGIEGTGEGTGSEGIAEGEAGPASGTSGTNPAAPEIDHD